AARSRSRHGPRRLPRSNRTAICSTTTVVSPTVNPSANRSAKLKSSLPTPVRTPATPAPASVIQSIGSGLRGGIEEASVGWIGRVDGLGLDERFARVGGRGEGGA